MVSKEENVIRKTRKLFLWLFVSIEKKIELLCAEWRGLENEKGGNLY